MKMNSLFRLYIYKQKGKLRNIARKRSSLLTTIFLVLLYGLMISVSIMNQADNQASIQELYNLKMNLNLLIMLDLGLLVLALMALLLRKNGSLFLEEDAYYLFSGPFSEKQIMRYLIFNSVLQAFFFSLIGEFIFYQYSFNVVVSGSLGLMVLLVNFMVSLFFIILTDVFYLYGVSDRRHRMLSKVFAGILVGMAVAVFAYFLVSDNFNISTAFSDFVLSRAFYLVPVIGYAKMVLSSCVNGELTLMITGFALLLASIALVYTILVRFNGEYKEQVLIDSKVVNDMLKENKKAGFNREVREVKNGNTDVNYHQKAFAVFSKNWLLMKKTKSYFNRKSLIIMILYIVIARFSGLGFLFYLYLNAVILFIVVSTGDLLAELKNYQLYLIPDTAFNKLKAIIILPLLQAAVYNVVSLTLAAIILGTTPLYYLGGMLFSFGAIFIFIAGSVLSVKLLGESTNLMFESLIRMLIMFVGMIPSVAAAVFIIMFMMDKLVLAVILAAAVTFIINVAVAFAVLYFSRSMLFSAE